MKSSRQRREDIKRLGQLTEAQAALGWGIALVLIALLGTIYLRQTSQIAMLGREVQLLQINLDEARRKNGETERQIAEAQSLVRLQAEAARMGFVPAGADDIDYIIVENYPETAVSMQPIATITPVEYPTNMTEAVLWTIQSSVTTLARGEARE